MDRIMKHLIALPVLTALASSAAQSYVLDFGSDRNAPPALCSSTLNGRGTIVTCFDGAAISQNYGDIAEVVDVTYSAPLRVGESLHWWAENFNSLYGVAYADGSNANSKARIELKPLAPNTKVTLTGFNLGSYPRPTILQTNISIYVIDSVTPLFKMEKISVSKADLLIPNISSAYGLWIEWQNSAYNVAIDNIRFSVTAVVPEPDRVALLLGGLVVLRWACCRERRAGSAKSDPLLTKPQAPCT
jgi:hypothetical protein